MVKDVRKTLAPMDNTVSKALRDGFGEGMMHLGEHDARVVALCADLTESDRLVEFRKAYPNRFVEVGVAEQNLVGVGAGMTHAGKVAYVASFAVFCPGRSWDQIRVSACYSNADVKIYGGHAGITVGEDGATHQALEDVAILRCLPRMLVCVPADAEEMRKATILAASRTGPVYLRGGRAKQQLVTTSEMPFEFGEANMLRAGKDVTIIACGIMVREALIAAQTLAKKKIDARVLNMHTIKPIDEDAIITAASETGCIVTAEEHQIIGGLGSAVSEVVSAHFPVPVERVGVRDTFGESGVADALLDKYGLRASDIVSAAEAAVLRKKHKKQVFAPAARDIERLPKISKMAKMQRKPKKSVKKKSTKKTKGKSTRKLSKKRIVKKESTKKSPKRKTTKRKR